jgi:hypothetical protein
MTAGFGSATAYERAKVVVEQGAPELVHAVERGEVAVSTAATVAAELPLEEQVELVARSEAEILAAAREIRKRNRSARKADDFYPTPDWLVQALLRYLEASDAKIDGCADWLRLSFRTVLDAGAGKGSLASEVGATAAARGEAVAINAVELNPQFCAELQEKHPAWTVEQGDFFAWAEQARQDGRRWRFVVTNPPFGRWQEWVDACFGLPEEGGYLCVLGFVNVLGAQSRAAWWREHRPDHVLLSPRRPQYRDDADNGDPRDTCWIVWRVCSFDRPWLRTALDWLDTELTGDAAGTDEAGDGGEEATA